MSETSPRLPDACASGRMPAPLRIGPLVGPTPLALAPPAAVPDPLGPHVLIHPWVTEFRQVLRYPEHRTGYREAADGVLRGS